MVDIVTREKRLAAVRPAVIAQREFPQREQVVIYVSRQSGLGVEVAQSAQRKIQ